MARIRSGRRLAAIMFTDLVGYSALAQRNESLALRKLAIHRRLVRSLIARYNGRDIETAGDAFLLEFTSSLDAVRYAVALQKQHAAFSRELPADEQIVVRIGVHLGDVESSGKSLLGDCVNIAARILPLSPPGGLVVSEYVHVHVHNNFEVVFQPLGPQLLKNIVKAVDVFALDAAAVAAIAENPPPLPQLDQEPRRLPLQFVAAASVAGLLAVGGYRLYLELHTPLVDKSIAVLPFENFGDPQNQYFTDGLQDSLITDLAQIHGLKVIARSSVMQYREGKRDMRAIGEQLGVSRLVEGSVQKEGDHLRINIQMIDPKTASHVWAQLYDRRVADVFAVESEVSEHVADSLQVAMTGGEKRAVESSPTSNPQALNAYLQGNFFSARSDTESLQKSIGFYQDALRLDPHFAPALASLASVWSTFGDHSAGEQAADAYDKARAAAQQALKLDANLAQAHHALGVVLLNADWNIAAAQAEFRTAEALAPAYAQAKIGLAATLSSFGRLDESIEISRQAIELDPLHTANYLNQAINLVSVARYDEAERMVRKTLELQPGYPAAYAWLTIIEIKRGDAAQALIEAQQEPDPAWKAYAIALARQANGDRALADASLNTLIETYADDAPFQIADVYALRGDADKAFEWLNRAAVAHDPGVTDLLVDPFLPALKSDPRFDGFCQKVGLPLPV